MCSLNKEKHLEIFEVHMSSYISGSLYAWLSPSEKPCPHLAIFSVSFKTPPKHTSQFIRVGMQRGCCLPPQVRNLSSGH